MIKECVRNMRRRTKTEESSALAQPQQPTTAPTKTPWNTKLPLRWISKDGDSVEWQSFRAATVPAPSPITHLERAHQGLVHAHHRTRVVELPAVVGSAENGDQLALCKELITVLDDLVCAAYEVKVMCLEELHNHVRAEDVGYATVILSPPDDVLVRVRPQKIAEEAWRRGRGGERKEEGQGRSDAEAAEFSRSNRRKRIHATI